MTKIVSLENGEKKLKSFFNLECCFNGVFPLLSLEFILYNSLKRFPFLGISFVSHSHFCGNALSV